MSSSSPLEAIFFAALEKESAAERSAFLVEACTGDRNLHDRLERMLAAQGSFLEHPLLEADADALKGVERTIVFGDGSTCDEEGEADFLGQTDMAQNTGEHSDEILLSYLEPATSENSLGHLGHYGIFEVIGRGAFGTVLRAFDEKLQRVVAIKVLAPEMAATSPARKRFLREARTSAQIRHENVVAIYAVEDEPIPYLVMEYIAGKTLQQRLDEQGPLDLPDVLRVGKQIADGLAAAHEQGLIHRDIKPGNILLEGGMDEPVKITDFGLARTADDASMTQSGVIAGTPMYMAPEQAHGQKLDQRADLFSLGSVLYQMLSGRPPFRAQTTMAVLKRVTEDTPRPILEIIPETPAWICELIAHLHEKDPDNRYSSAREVSELLAKCATDLDAGRVPEIPNPTRANTNNVKEGKEAKPVPASSNLSVWVKAAAVLLVLLAGLGITEATGVTKFSATVIRLATGSGMLVIEASDPGVKITIDGEEVTITGGGVEELTLRPGDYTVTASKDGKQVKRELVSVTRNGRTVVRVFQESLDTEAPIAKKLPLKRAPDFTNSIGMEFVLVPTGGFWMGGGGSKVGDKHVAIPHDFYLGRYEVTQEEWDKVMKTNPSSFQRGGMEANKVKAIDENELKRFPVDNVSWHDCQEFIRRLNEMETVKGWKYRLPTEIEWEYACRGGPMKNSLTSAYFFYLEKPLNSLSSEEANIRESGLGRPCKVGSYPPNRQ
ncbi:MAG: protein kinase, partial [Planctomycetaceae bacterium]|nr:protein kinase [Planctomycetaceae bacterium]